MRTIVGNSTKNTKDIKKAERIVNLDPNNLPSSTNVSQYGAGGSDIKDLETAKHWASAAEKSAVKAETNANKTEDFFNKVVDAADDVLNNTEDSFNYLEEIKGISVKIDGQEANIDTLEKSTIAHSATAEAAAQIASNSASSARASEANAAASASSANNSAVSAKESEQNAKASEVAADASATKADQKLAQTEAVYDKTIDDVSNAVQSYLKDKGGFDPASGLPIPDSWLNIFGERKNLSCLWVAEKAGTVEGIGFNEGDVLLYNAIVDRYGRFSGELVTGGGGGGPTEFFNDIKLSAGKRILGTDSRGSAVELIKLVNDIVEAGDKTKPMHILTRDPQSAFVCVANSTRGFDNYEIYHAGNKPTAADVGAHSKAEADAKFLDLAGTQAMSGPLNTTDTIYVKTREVYHPGNKPPASDLDAVSLTRNESITGQKKFTQNPIVENASPQISFAESDTNTTVAVKVEARKLTMSTPTSTPFDVDFSNSTVSVSNPKTKTAQGTTADSLVRKDYTDTELAKKLNHTGNGTLAGDLIVTGKITVEGTGSLFRDINTTGQVKENNIRVYSPANKPNAVDVGALPISGGSVGGALHVVGNITTDGTISEKGQRVYSPNNKPTPADIGASVAADEWKLKSKGIGSSSSATDFDTIVDLGWYHSSSAANLYTNAPSGSSGAFTLYIDSIGPSNVSYRRQTVYDYNSSKTWVREKVTDGWRGWAQVYDTRNKPTAADIGAIGIENVYDKIQSDARFWQRTETVTRSFSTDVVNSYAKSASEFKDVTNLRSYGVFSSSNAGFPDVYGSGIFQGRIAGVENHGWTLFHKANSTDLSLGKQKLDGSGFDWYKLYHTGNKPSAVDLNLYTKAEVDAKDNLKLNLTGGTLTGTLKGVAANFSGSLELSENSAAPLSLNRGSQVGIKFQVGTSTTRYVGVDVNGGLRFGPDLDHSKNSLVYHTGNKPTAVDVGALPITGGTVTGVTNFSSTVNINNQNLIVGGINLFGSDSTVLRIGDTSRSRFMRLECKYLTVRDGNTTDHKVFHEGNLLFSKTPDADKLVQRTDTSAVTGSSFVSASDFRVTIAPKGGVYKGVSSVTGSIKITLPAAKTGTMMKLYVSVYDYRNDTSFDAVLSGYEYYSGDVQRWLNCSAVITGGASTTNHPVYFGQEDGKACVWVGVVGATWAYPHVVISKVETGYTGGNNDRWSSGWTVGFATNLGTIDRTISDCLIKPSDAANIADTEPTSNTIVRRSGTGGGAFKGRVLIASSNDTDVAAGTASLDFTSASGNIYGQIGDVNSSQDIQVYASAGRVVLDSNADVQVLKKGLSQRLLAGGLLASDVYTDASKIPTNGIYSKGDVTIGGFLNVATSKLSISGVNVIGTDANLVRIGDSGFARTMYLNAKNGEVNVRSDGSTAYRVYHEGFKPTAANVGALPITGGTLTGSSGISMGGGAVFDVRSTDNGSAPASTSKIRMVGFGKRAEGIYFTDADSTAGTWFSGIPYSAAHARYQIGFAADNSQADYVAKALFTVHKDGTLLAGTYKIYHEGNKPSTGDLNTYTKTEIDAKDNLKLNLTGGVLTGNVSITNSSGHLRVGGSTGGFTGVIGGKRQKKVGDTSSLDYGTYWAYDASVDDAGTWSAVRSSLGRKWVVDMGYHNDGFRVRTFTGDATATWDDTAWTDILQATPSTLTFKGNNVYHAGNKPTAADVGLGSVNNTADTAKNVLSATKLTTARTIAGVSFDGTANISLSAANVGALASGANAVSATKLATPRAINGVNFDGTAAITIADSTKVPTTRKVNNKALSGDISLTASDVGALATSGGALTGKLSFGTSVSGVSSGNPSLYGFEVYGATNSTTSYGLNLLAPGSGSTWGTNIYAANQADRWIYFSQKTGTAGTMADYTVRAKIDVGTGEIYANGDKRVYHTGYKPTPADIGALASNGTAEKVNIVTTFSGKYPMVVNVNGLLYSHASAQFEGSTGTLTATRFAGNGASLTGITASQVGALASGGTAAAATKLATARTIAGVSFDGTANISITASNVGAVAKTGDTMTGSLLNHSIDAGFNMYRNVIAPGGGQFRTATSVSTGAIKITLPVSWTSTMFMMTVDVYSYAENQTISFKLGGYNYNSGAGSWVNTSVTQLGGGVTHNVRFGHDGTKCCIWIGETTTAWSYTQVTVKDFQFGYSDTSTTRWNTGWNVSITNAAMTTVTTTKTNHVFSPNHLPTWAEVSGKPSTFAPTAHTHTAAEAGALPSGGTAVAATKLATPRAINGVNFDGTAAITITAAANGGNAATATKLQTARTIAGVSFDGGSNISISASNVGALALSGGTLTGNLTVKTPTVSTTVVDTDNNAPVRMGSVNTGNTAGTYFVPLTQQTAQHGQGYNTHVTTGLVKNGYGSGWGEGVSGFFVGVGGNDGSATEYFTMAYGGKIKHSLGHEFYSTSFRPTATDVGLSYLAQTSTEGLVVTLNGKRTVIGSRNTTWSHFDTDATDGFYFYKNINAANLSSRGTVSGITANATGVASGQGLAFNGKTAIGGVNDAWLRMNPHNQFGSGIYCGSTGTLRHDGNLQAGGWAASGKVSKVQANHYDSSWTTNGVAAFSTNNPDSSGAHWLLASYYDGTNIRSGIQVLSNTTGNMRFYTNRRGSYVDIAGGTITGALSGNATTATTLQTARTINGVSFNGGANITITAAANGGNAATATTLQTARTINGVSFNGSANITITAAANGGTSSACSGNAATATKLATVRTIGGTNFDGTANIDPMRIRWQDTRSTEFTPATARTYLQVTFQNGNSNGVGAAAADYYNLLHIPQYSDSSGGYGSQIAFTKDGKMRHRRGTSDTAWGSWNILYSTGNPPTAADVGALASNGTAVACSGNAATATALQNARTIGGVSFNGTANIVPTDISPATSTATGMYNLAWFSGTRIYHTNAKLQFQPSTGALVSSNNITAYSDIRVKDNIKNIPDALEKVMKLNGVTYTRTDQEDKEQLHTGVIAQEVEAVLPEAVITSENGDIKDFKSVAYGNLVGLLIEAIKELKQEVEELKCKK